jgi:hypothetical protein
MRTHHFSAFALGAAVGAFAAIVMPDNWSNLALMPWFVVWFVFPSFMVFASLSIVFGIDFVSNGGANAHLLAALWTLSVAAVMGTYGLGLSVLVMRFRHKEILSW